ncbi:MAG: HAD-IC family P-type ATPase, partial [Candidatus Methanomethylophilaceae archaeon]|nr:HAD-IC family P-type ATPase [Candidatus Methanomethylophilaceae archaeon]
AILNKYPEAPCELLEEIQFSSERKYSAVRIRTDSYSKVLYLGAYDILGSHLVDDLDLKARVKKKAAMGLRVLLLAELKDGPLFDKDKPRSPKGLKAVALLTVRDEVRPDCRETIDVFIKNDMDIKIISGDDPHTVKALATQAAIPGAMNVISGPELDALKGQERIDAVLATNIFGRMRPQQKEEVIDILQKQGRYVAMVGDGVNDVHSLKKANLGVALESGSGAARAVADIVLIKDNFAALPQALVEGRRVVNGMKNVLRLYLARNFTLIFLILLVFLFFGSIPLLPTNGAYYAFLSVSIVAFLMTLWSRPQRITESILPRVVHFALPAAMLIAFFGFLVYSVYQLTILNGLVDIPFTMQQLDEFGYFLTYEGSVEPSLVQRSAELAARNAMLTFVTLAGISLIFLAAPYYRFLSVDGELYDDIKPTLLAFLLFFLVWLVFQWDVTMFVAGVVPLRPVDYIFISGMVVVWLLVTLNVLRNRWLDGFTRWAVQKMAPKDGQKG